MTTALLQEQAGCGRIAAAPVAPLGKNADFGSLVPPQQLAQQSVLDLAAVKFDQAAPTHTIRGWHLRAVGRDLLRKAGYGYRVRFCGARISRNERGVTVYRRPDRAYGRVSGVCVCGQSVVCPVCGPRIAAFRSAEVADAFTRARNAGFEAILDTYTMPHWSGSSLGNEIKTFSRAWTLATKGKHSLAHRIGYLGSHTAREITFSDRNGWHYHHHQLRYHKPGTHDAVQLQASWLAALSAVERLSDGALEHAYRSDDVRDEAGARYTAKLALSVDASSQAVGLELSGSALKGRNIVRLLADHAAGDVEAGAVWLHGVKAVCDRKISSVRWSPGLRDKLGIASPEKADATIAHEERLKSDEYLGELTSMQWSAILRHRGEFTLVLAAQSGRSANEGRDAINEFLSAISCGEIHPDGLPEPTRQLRAQLKC